MTESRCLGNARTSRKGKIQVYIDKDMFDAVVELQANKNPIKMLQYIEKNRNLTKHNSQTIQSAICKKCGEDYQIYGYDGLCDDCRAKAD